MSMYCSDSYLRSESVTTRPLSKLRRLAFLTAIITLINNNVNVPLQSTAVLQRYCFIQFNVPFKIISLIEKSQSIGGAKREYPGKTT